MPKVRHRREEIIVERHALDSLVIFDVSEHELDELERETGSISDDLTFGVAGLSVGLSLLVVLLTVDIQSDRIYYSFLLVDVVGFLVALYCGIRWFRGRKKFKGVVQRIKARVGPLGEEGKEIDSEQLETLPPAEVANQ
ncbi:MAG: hypothetical protein FJX62_10305 [Alphaproteobacteria bacterium]|nr:hypothetical protein [Alphaproteobacteria bacterium]